MLTLTSPLCCDKNKSVITTITPPPTKISPLHCVSFNKDLVWSLNRYSGDPHDHTFIITFFLTCFILPLAVIIVCYSKLLRKLRKVSLVLLLEKSNKIVCINWTLCSYLMFYSEVICLNSLQTIVTELDGRLRRCGCPLNDKCVCCESHLLVFLCRYLTLMAGWWMPGSLTGRCLRWSWWWL